MKRHAFADLSDGSSPTPIPVLLDPAAAEPLTTGACVEIEGRVEKGPGKNQGLEIHASSAKILGESPSDYPLQKKYHSKEFLRQLPHLRWKTRTAQQVLRYRSWAINQISNYFLSQNCFQVNSPIITSSDCEGAGEVFKIEKSPEFFGKNAYLTVSSQLHLEVYAAALGRVWNLTPAFRAEASDTNRHLSEFWMIEPEFAFVDFKELRDLCENMVKAAVPSAQMEEDLLASKRKQEDKDRLVERWNLLRGKWNTISYAEAVKIIQDEHAKGNLQSSIAWGEGIASEHEKYLAGEVFKSPLFVTDYPSQSKPFYMKGSTEHPGCVECFDLLIPQVGELVGGSMREDSYDLLLKKIRDAGMDEESLSWYLDLRKFGSFPHGGYGMGFERLIMYVCGLDNIRDAVGFIRGFNALRC